MRHIIKLLIISLLLSPTYVLIAQEEPEAATEETAEAAAEETAAEEIAEESEPGEPEQTEEATPEESAPDESAPDESAPAEETPDESVPGEAAPAEEAPAVEEKPSEATTQEAPEVAISEEEETFELKGVTQTRKKWFKQANDYANKTQNIARELAQVVTDLHSSHLSFDKKIDKFYTDSGDLLDTLQNIENDVTLYMQKQGSDPKRVAELAKKLTSFSKGRGDIKSARDEVKATEQAILDLFSVADKQRAQALAHASKSEAIKEKIMNEQDPAIAEGHLNKIIEMHGAVVSIQKQINNLKEPFDKHLQKIETHMSSATSSGDTLLSQAKEIKAEIKKIGDEEAAKAKQEEAEAIEKIQKKIKHVTPIKLQWYEKIIVYISKAVLYLRDSLRSLFGVEPKEEVIPKDYPEKADVKTTGTVIDQLNMQIKKLERQKKFAKKIQDKLHELEKEKAKLVDKLKGKKISVTIPSKDPTHKETIGQIIKNIWFSFIELIKKTFFSIGNFINRTLEKAASLEKPRQTKPEQIPSEQPQPDEAPEEEAQDQESTAQESETQEPVEETPTEETAEESKQN